MQTLPPFGRFLRRFRQKCSDPDEPDRKLSQERLGELLGKELGLLNGGYSGAAVSDWERGASKIQADQRSLLISLLKVLRAAGGLETPSEANLLLEAGDYRTLNPDELRKIFPEIQNNPDDVPSIEPVSQPIRGKLQALLASILPPTDLEYWSSLSAPGAIPGPAWPHILAALLRRSTGAWSVFQYLQALAWLLVWSFSIWLLTPLLRWPFANPEHARQAVILYMAGSLIIPLLVGALTRTKNDEFWKKTGLENDLMTRLYTHQGAGVGFHIGYFFVFIIFLLAFYIHLSAPDWLGFLPVAFILLFSYTGARLVPYNLLRAFGRLKLSDGGIFFIFMLVGPLWGFFFLNFYALLLEPASGTVMILAAAMLITAMMARRYQQTGSTLVPIHWWVSLYGSILILYEISTAQTAFGVVVLAGLIFSLSALLAFRRIHMTLPGALGLLAACGLFSLSFKFNVLTSWALGCVALFIWWRWGKGHLSFPVSFLGIILASMGSAWAIKNQWLTDIQASLVFGCSVLALIAWEYKSRKAVAQPGEY